jgi:2-oxoglutarate dehydrogenase E2 component (dihydrolipoamide succinyltransferase)
MSADASGNIVAVHLPQTGTQTAATFLEWTVQVGDEVSAGEKLASAETEKAVVEIEAPVAGRITALLVQPQDEINTDTAIAFIAPRSATGVSSAAVPEHSSPAAIPAKSLGNEGEKLDSGAAEPTRPIPSSMRRAAENLLWVSQNTARASTTVEVDFEAVAAVRSATALDFRTRHGVRLTYLPFIAFAALRALRELPQIAARIDLAANTLDVPAHVHLGIAVAREAGLIVPVIRNAEKLCFVDLARQIDAAAERVRAGTYTASDVLGGTFTISNPGGFGSYLSSPIMNRGETSILCVDAVERRAVVVESDIVARLRAFLTLAFDHRVVDGMLALKLLTGIKARLEACDASWILEDQSIDEHAGSAT